MMKQPMRRITSKAGLAIFCSILFSSLSPCEGGNLAVEKESLHLRSSSHATDQKIGEIFDLTGNREDIDQDEFLKFELAENGKEADLSEEIAGVDDESTGRRKLTWWVTLWTALHGPPPPPGHHNGGGDSGNGGGNGNGGGGESNGGNGGGSSGGSGGRSGSGTGGSGGGRSWYNPTSWFSNESSGGGNGGSSAGGGGSSGGSGSDAGEGVKATRSLSQSTSIWMMLIAACAATCAIAAIVIGQKQAAKPRSHALHGAVKNRMRLFSGFANRALCSIERPPREVEIAASHEGSRANYGELA